MAAADKSSSDPAPLHEGMSVDAALPENSNNNNATAQDEVEAFAATKRAGRRNAMAVSFFTVCQWTLLQL